MSATGRRTAGLREAIRGFERAAHHLERSHQGLQARVSLLETELEETHRAWLELLDDRGAGGAVLSGDGTVLQANGAFSESGLGKPGERVPDWVRERVLDGDDESAEQGDLELRARRLSGPGTVVLVTGRRRDRRDR